MNEHTMTAIDQFVIVRTYSAGVHVGFLRSLEGTQVLLTECSNLWQWEGANTINEIALRGVNRKKYTRISERVPSKILTEVIEIIPVNPQAIDSLAPIWNAS